MLPYQTKTEPWHKQFNSTGVLNPELLISVGGVTTILRSLANVKSARMAEALVGSLLYLQNKPSTRLRAGLSLDCLAAPYTDLQPGDKAK
jgi:hypothetical protein